jgi:hypothetical protein
MMLKLFRIGLVLVMGLTGIWAILGLVSHQAQAMPTWQQVNQDGFGDALNQQVPSLAVFGDHLYAGVWHNTGISATAQIWRTSTGTGWQMVDTRPVSGAADMIAFKGSIYAGSWDGHIWSSPNGTSWTEIINDGFDGSNQGISRFQVYGDTLYASTWGDGTEIWRTINGVDWEPFVEDGLGDLHNTGAPASEVFNGLLYYGVANATTGAQLWQSNGISTSAVITDGFGITNNQSISALVVFGDALYASLWNDQAVQVYRSSDGSNWDQVLDGLGNPPGYEVSALQVYRDKLYLVVQCDTSGLQVWRTSNGTTWEQVGFNGFSDPNNRWSYWDNATTVFEDRLYVATNNFVTGGEVWQMTAEPYKLYLPCTLNSFTACPVYTDDFSDPSSGWPRESDSVATLDYVNGEYQILVKQADYLVFAYGDFGSSDFKVEVDVRPATHLNGADGLIFSMNDAGFYMYLNNENWYTLWRWNDAINQWTMLIDWTQSPALKAGDNSNRLGVVRHDDNIALYGNGQLLTNYVDDTYHGTVLAMVADAFSNNYDARFDNLTVQTTCINASSLPSPSALRVSTMRIGTQPGNPIDKP